jgi:hypothetical protein
VTQFKYAFQFNASLSVHDAPAARGRCVNGACSVLPVQREQEAPLSRKRLKWPLAANSPAHTRGSERKRVIHIYSYVFFAGNCTAVIDAVAKDVSNLQRAMQRRTV